MYNITGVTVESLGSLPPDRLVVCVVQSQLMPLGYRAVWRPTGAPIAPSESGSVAVSCVQEIRAGDKGSLSFYVGIHLGGEWREFQYGDGFDTFLCWWKPS